MYPRSHCIDALKTAMPAPGPPSSCSASTSQSSRNSSAIGADLSPIFVSGCPTARPGVSRSTRKLQRPAKRNVRSVDAKTTKRSASGALVTNVFVPLRTYRPPRSVAVVLRLKASEPESGSDIACPATIDPSQSPGRYRRFWRSVPKDTSGVSQAQSCALRAKMNPLSVQP